MWIQIICKNLATNEMLFAIYLLECLQFDDTFQTSHCIVRQMLNSTSLLIPLLPTICIQWRVDTNQQNITFIQKTTKEEVLKVIEFSILWNQYWKAFIGSLFMFFEIMKFIWNMNPNKETIFQTEITDIFCDFSYYKFKNSEIFWNVVFFLLQ